jgi:hypothetical protein
MEPERQIEKVLRAFAKKRREQAGAPPELHPVDRRLLQDEVLRQSRKPPERNFFLALLAGIRPRLTFILCVVALSIVGAWFVLPLFSPAKSRSMRVARGNEYGMDKPASESSARPATPPARAPSESDTALKKELLNQNGQDADGQNRREKSNFELARNQDEKQVPPATAAASSPVVRPDSGQKLAGAMSNSDFLEEARLRAEPTKSPTTTTTTTTNALAFADGISGGGAGARGVPGSESETVANAPAGRAGEGFSGSSGDSIVFKRVQEPAAVAAAALSAQTKSAETFGGVSTVATVSNSALLDSFAIAVDANGRELQVKDHDGSVYRGYLQVEESLVPGQPVFETKARAEPASPDRSLATNGRAPVTNEKLAKAWSFRVGGTNETLKQNIVFSGNLLLIWPEGSPVVLVGRDRWAPAAGATQFTLPYYRINGQALIANTGKVDILTAPPESVGRR